MTTIKQRQIRPHLHEQMAICDANYIRLLKLLPALRRLPGEPVALRAVRHIVVPGVTRQTNMQVNFTLVESFRYTAEIEIVQLRPQAEGHYRTPRMRVRLYYDARTAEVISYQYRRQHFQGSPDGVADWQGVTLEKMQLNSFLGEWLTMCLNKGLARESDVLSQSGCSGISG